MRPLALLLAILAASIALAEDHPTLPLGSAAPDFDLPGVDGKSHTLAEYKDAQLLAVVFTCNHCPTAQAYEERIKDLVRDYRTKGVAVVAISPNSPAAVRPDELGYTDLGDDLDDMKARAKERGYNFPYLYDGETEAVSLKYGPVATPHVFLFDRQRVLRYRGRIDDAERLDLVKSRDLRNAMDDLLEGKEPRLKDTKVFGCSTKWAGKTDANARWLEKVHKEPVTLATADAAALKALRENKGTGKLRLISVWSTRCGPCVAEFDDFVDTRLRFRQRDFELVTVAAQMPDEKDMVLKFLQKHHSSARNLIYGETDEDKLTEALDPEWKGPLPHTLLVAPDGKVLYRHTGEVDFLELRRKIVPALNAITPWPGMK